MKRLITKTSLKTWNRLISKLKYFRKECKKKDAIIKALEEQLSTLRGMYV